MLLVGLTGNIASGKTTVARHLASLGAVVLDSDTAARDAVAPGTPALAAIASRFGAGMLQADGSLDRARMGAHVFGNPDERHALEAIIHPAVEAGRVSAIARARGAGARVVVCDIPLLFEVRLAWQFPRIILVDAPEPERLARLVRDRAMTPELAAARIRSQMPAALKRGRADVVLMNDGSRESLHARLEATWPALIG
jgi:dephospho-CoA kinase